MKNLGILYFFAGKMGSGKSTKSKQITKHKNAVLISEDEWLELLYPTQIQSFDDYLKYSKQIKPLVKKHIQTILKTGTDVVMDFPGNTVNQRKWLLNIASEINANHQLIFLNLTDEQCIKQILKRNNEDPSREHFDTIEMFNYVSSFFEVPHDSEDLNIVEIKQ